MITEPKPGDLVVAACNYPPLARGATYEIAEVCDTKPGDAYEFILKGLEDIRISAVYLRRLSRLPQPLRRAEPPAGTPVTTGLTWQPITSKTDADRYPDDNPKTRFGLAKPSISLIPATALVLMAGAMRDGADKYGAANWREKPVSSRTYLDAALRHIFAYVDGEQNADDSGVHHLAHAASCLAIIMDAETQGTLNDNRPHPGKTAELIREKTQPVAA